MIINKHRIRSLAAFTKELNQGQTIIICVKVSDIELDKAVNIGFTPTLNLGDSILPKAIGNITKFNAEGKEIPQKDKPKETHYRQQEWTWKEFRGRYSFEEKSKIVDIPYERYPREYISPPAVELMIATNTISEKFIISDPIEFSLDNQLIIHIVNLFLEIFGHCEVRSENLDSIIKAPLRRLNWNILPPGKKPWGDLKALIGQTTNSLTSGNKVVVEKRLEFINSYKPDFIALGQAGFSGYFIFGFPKKNLYILESIKTNNATYIIENNWKVLSGLTKAEILENNLHKGRVIHRESWFNQITRFLQV